VTFLSLLLAVLIGNLAADAVGWRARVWARRRARERIDRSLRRAAKAVEIRDALRTAAASTATYVERSK
jgi:hypothetical protein